MRNISFVVILSCAILTGCRKHRIVSPPPPPPSMASNTLIEGAVFKGSGTWAYFERGTTRSLTATPTGRAINWSYRYSGSPRGSGSTSSGFGLSDPSDPWFIYVEAPNRLWFFDGSRHLSYRNWNPDETGDAIVDGTLKLPVSDIPSGLVPHLPAELQKLFPPVNTKPRPSI